MTRVSIPADIDRPDTLIAGLTARQLLSLCAVGIPLFVFYQATSHLIPGVVFLPIAVLISTAAFAVVTISHDGVSVDRTARAAFSFSRAPKVLVTQGDIALPADIGALGLPVVSVSPVGVMDLGVDGSAVICSLQGTDLNLKSGPEQEALTRSLGRFLNSGDLIIQFVVHCEPVDLSAYADGLLNRAATLPTIGLERCARDHAAFLTSVGQSASLLRRDSYLVIRDPRGTVDLIGRSADAVGLLRAAGIIAEPLDGSTATATLLRLAGSNNRRAISDDQVQMEMGS